MSEITHVNDPGSTAQKCWQEAIERQLLDWERSPGAFADDGFAPPTASTIQRVLEFVHNLPRLNGPPLTSIYPDPNGGIVLERRQDDVCEKYHFWDDGTADYARFHGTTLVERSPL